LNKDDKFYCIKITTGETLLGEVVDFNDTTINLKDPILVRSSAKGDDEMMTAAPWMPYANSDNVPIPMKMIFFFEPINSRFKKFYGHVIMQYKVAEIKQKVEDNMDGGNDYHIMKLGVEEIKAVTDEISTKFGIENQVDVSGFEKHLEKFKSKMH